MFKTIKEKKGYVYCNGSSGKKWIRGRTMFSVGKAWISQNEYLPCITKTNLDTAEVSLASLAEHKRFLTQESYEELLLNEFKQLSKIF